MNQRIKRSISLLLALAMLLGMAVFPVSAAENDTPAEEAAEMVSGTVPEAETEAPAEDPEEEAEPSITGDCIITAAGTYRLAEGMSGTIVVATTEPVTFVGWGAKWDESGTMTSAAHSGLYIDCTTQAGVNVTLENIYINNAAAVTGVNGEAFGLVGFTGTGNALNFEGVNVVEYNISGGSNPGGIHVRQGDGLTIGGSGTVYFYKSAQGAGIGGSSGEVNGDITFVMTGSLFAKGSKQGALIGAGSGSANVEGAPGAISFVSGTYNLVTNSRGAAIGGSAGTIVNVGPGANININVDYSGAAVGGGGYAQGNDASGGTLVVNGGSLRTYIDTNAANNATTGWNGKAFTAGINDAAITAQRVNGQGEAVYLMAFDTARLTTAATSFEVYVDDSTELFYQGGLPEYGYVQEGLDKAEQLSVSSTPSNWYQNGETNLYFYLTGEDHILTVNGESFSYYWNELTQSFDTEKKANITFCVDPADAQIIVSDGIGYTYLEETHKGYFFEAVEADAAKTVFPLAPGAYTFTITRDGYYASVGTFKVTEELHAVSINTTSNINAYLKDDVFTIPMTAFVRSTNEGAWDGVTIDVSWYQETASELHISTPAQLAGMAAIVNGIYNAEITTIIDDVDGDGVTETYTPYAYAHLEGCKIIAVNSEGSTGSNNLVTTDTYWYGAKSEGTYTARNGEMPLPADFNGQTVYIDQDLDMGGHQVDGVWTGARYMTIGGQSLMHYIDYGKWMSDGYSHIGSSFNGTLDGQGHIIQNLYCDRYADGSNYGDSVSVALVGRLGNHDADPDSIAAVDPTVRNIAVTGYVYGRRSVGGIVGKIGRTTASEIRGDTSTGGIIENCLNFAQVVNTDAKGVGGICGAGWNQGVIRNCANFGNIYAGRQNGGGICGSGEVPVINCYNVGYVDAISYSQGQAIGTDNGGGVYTNVYWLTGSSIADSVDTYLYPAVYKHSGSDTLYEISSFAGFRTEEFMEALNGDSRAWVFVSDSDTITSVMADVSFRNCKLDTEGITAAGMPVPRCFITEVDKVTAIEKTADPVKLSYVAGQTFDTTGLKIVATWSDGTIEQLEDYTVSITRALETTDTRVTVSGTRGGMDYSFDLAITVEADSLYSLAITSKPSSTVYALGEAFDPTGMVVRAVYTADPSTKVALDASAYTYTLTGSVLTVSYTFAGKTLTDAVELTLLDTPAPGVNDSGSYELSCPNDVLWFANQVKAYKRADLSAVVVNDITVADSFTGIGTASAKYAGTFDGQGHTLTLNMTATSNAGLFAYVDGATIRNVTVAGTVTSTATSAGIAGIAAYVQGSAAVIENCINQADITGGGYVGGIVGKTTNAQLTISGCVNEGSVHASAKYAGGIAGYLNGSEHNAVTGCVNRGEVFSSGNEVGGIAGYVKYFDITACENEGIVAGQYDVGGIVGLIEEASGAISISRCINNGAVEGYQYVGGIAGNNDARNAPVDSCVNNGNITFHSGGKSHAGGIVGQFACQVTNCYNTGNIHSANTDGQEPMYFGGIAGDYDAISGSGSVSNCYNTGAVTYDHGSCSYAGIILGNGPQSNCFYLDTALANSGSDVTADTDNGNSRTSDELKAADMAALLGDAFRSVNGCSYPILAWQNDSAAVMEHSFGGDGVCTICGEADPEFDNHDHLWNDWAATTAPTCTEAGVETSTCTLCGETETREVAALGHSYGEWTETTAPTCTEAGVETSTCTLCGETETREIAALGHSYGDWTETTAPTCMETGVETSTCTLCGETETREVAALGHSYGDWGNDENGHWHVCTACGEQTDANVHTFAWIVDKQETAREDGLMHEECTLCGYTKAGVVIPAAGEEQDDVPKTRDMNANPAVFILVMFCAAAGACAFIFKRKTVK